MGVKIRKRGGEWYSFVNYHGRCKAKCVGSSRQLAEHVAIQAACHHQVFLPDTTPGGEQWGTELSAFLFPFEERFLGY
jgi:hypothetical protein